MITKKTAAIVAASCLISGPLFFAIGWFVGRREAIARPLGLGDMPADFFQSLGSPRPDRGPMHSPEALPRAALNLATLKAAHALQPKARAPLPALISPRDPSPAEKQAP
jgi:hypothetical protein